MFAASEGEDGLHVPRGVLLTKVGGIICTSTRRRTHTRSIDNPVTAGGAPFLESAPLPLEKVTGYNARFSCVPSSAVQGQNFDYVSDAATTGPMLTIIRTPRFVRIYDGHEKVQCRSDRGTESKWPKSETFGRKIVTPQGRLRRTTVHITPVSGHFREDS